MSHLIQFEVEAVKYLRSLGVMEEIWKRKKHIASHDGDIEDYKVVISDKVAADVDRYVAKYTGWFGRMKDIRELLGMEVEISSAILGNVEVIKKEGNEP